MLLTPPAPSTAAEGAGRSSVAGCSGDDAELHAPEDGFGVTLFGVELMHVPGIRNRTEDSPIVPKRCSHLGKAIQESLGGLRAHRILAGTERTFRRCLWARVTRQASSRSQSVAAFDQECSERAMAWLRVTVSDWPGLTYRAASSIVRWRLVCLRTSARFIGFMGVFLSGALSAPDATSPLNCCGGGWWPYLFEVSRQYLRPDLISEMIFRTILLKPWWSRTNGITRLISPLRPECLHVVSRFVRRERE